MELNTDWKQFVESLNSSGVEYLLVGALAVAHHALPRNTGDIDFFVRRSPENARRIVEAIERFGFASLNLRPEDFLEDDSVIQLGLPPRRIDLINHLAGVGFDEAWHARVPMELGGVTLHVISKEHLLANKRALGRQQDLADVAALEGRSRADE
jgi:hypothetical protein